MRVLKEVLVLAVLVLILAFAARQLEGIDAGKIESGVPSFAKSLKDLFGWDSKEKAESEKPTKADAAAKREERLRDARQRERAKAQQKREEKKATRENAAEQDAEKPEAEVPFEESDNTSGN